MSDMIKITIDSAWLTAALKLAGLIFGLGGDLTAE